MKVKLIKAKTVLEFASKHANGRKHFEAWLFAVKLGDWSEPVDIICSYKGNLLGGGSNRVVFDLGGNSKNSFRIIAGYVFGRKYVYLHVNWIGTHEQYNALSLENKKTITNY